MHSFHFPCSYLLNDIQNIYHITNLRTEQERPIDVAKVCGVDISVIMRLNRPRFRGIRAISKLKAGTELELKALFETAGGPGLFSAQKVLQKRKQVLGGKPHEQYLVQWKNVPLHQSTWEPEENVSALLINEFQEKQSAQKRKRVRSEVADIGPGDVLCPDPMRSKQLSETTSTFYKTPERARKLGFHTTTPMSKSHRHSVVLIPEAGEAQVRYLGASRKGSSHIIRRVATPRSLDEGLRVQRGLSPAKKIAELRLALATEIESRKAAEAQALDAKKMISRLEIKLGSALAVIPMLERTLGCITDA